MQKNEVITKDRARAKRGGRGGSRSPDMFFIIGKYLTGATYTERDGGWRHEASVVINLVHLWLHFPNINEVRQRSSKNIHVYTFSHAAEFQKLSADDFSLNWRLRFVISGFVYKELKFVAQLYVKKNCYVRW